MAARTREGQAAPLTAEALRVALCGVLAPSPTARNRPPQSRRSFAPPLRELPAGNRSHSSVAPLIMSSLASAPQAAAQRRSP